MSFAKKLRQGKIKPKQSQVNNEADLVLLLDDVYDTYNVGGMYRIGDAAKVDKIYHCGATAKLPDPKISRAAVGLEKYIANEQGIEITSKLKELKSQGFTIVALEQTSSSQPYHKVKYQGKIALVCGNETFGVSDEALKLCDLIVELPMFGINKSLNVVVSTGIVLYQIRLTLRELI